MHGQENGHNFDLLQLFESQHPCRGRDLLAIFPVAAVGLMYLKSRKGEEFVSCD
jgi:hypothetical protein